MATVNVGGSQQYLFFGSGSDLLPRPPGMKTEYRLVAVLDNGDSAKKSFDIKLQKTDGTQDEKVTGFPAVAGDIVFFTTTFVKADPCSAPDANLYALTFIGGAAYDNTGDGKVDKKDSEVVKKITGARATAPFIVDRHLAFTAGNKLEMFGDSQAFNNGIGQAGVRILSWREIR